MKNAKKSSLHQEEFEQRQQEVTPARTVQKIQQECTAAEAIEKRQQGFTPAAEIEEH